VSYFHRVNKDVETGAKALWDRKTDSAVSVEVGTKYALDRDAFVKVKIDKNGSIFLFFNNIITVIAMNIIYYIIIGVIVKSYD